MRLSTPSPSLGGSQCTVRKIDPDAHCPAPQRLNVPICSGMWFDPGYGYHVDKTTNVAKGNESESIFAVRDRRPRPPSINLRPLECYIPRASSRISLQVMSGMVSARGAHRRWDEEQRRQRPSLDVMSFVPLHLLCLACWLWCSISTVAAALTTATLNLTTVMMVTARWCEDHCPASGNFGPCTSSSRCPLLPSALVNVCRRRSTSATRTGAETRASGVGRGSVRTLSRWVGGQVQSGVDLGCLGRVRPVRVTSLLPCRTRVCLLECPLAHCSWHPLPLFLPRAGHVLRRRHQP
jgi:hypothetical protein